MVCLSPDLLAFQENHGIEAEGCTRGCDDITFSLRDFQLFQPEDGAEERNEGGQGRADEITDLVRFALRREVTAPEMEKLASELAFELEPDVLRVAGKRCENVVAGTNP